jgi:hypothetical protein
MTALEIDIAQRTQHKNYIIMIVPASKDSFSARFAVSRNLTTYLDSGGHVTRINTYHAVHTIYGSQIVVFHAARHDNSVLFLRLADEMEVH